MEEPTREEIGDLLRRLVDTAVEMKDRAEAAEARIEELEKERDEWKSLAEAAIKDDASKNIYYAELQTKLAKAVGLIQFLDKEYQHVWGVTAKSKVRTTLAELKVEDRG